MTRFFVAHEDMQTDRFSLTGDNAAHGPKVSHRLDIDRLFLAAAAGKAEEH